jgi:hypothetical protein
MGLFSKKRKPLASSGKTPLGLWRSKRLRPDAAQRLSAVRCRAGAHVATIDVRGCMGPGSAQQR